MIWASNIQFDFLLPSALFREPQAFECALVLGEVTLNKMDPSNLALEEPSVEFLENSLALESRNVKARVLSFAM